MIRLADHTTRHVHFEVSDRVATVRLDRPERKNPLTFDSYGEMRDLFNGLRYATDVKVVVVTGDVPLGASREEALAAIRLVGLTNDVSLRNLIPGELAKGFGFFQSKPASAFSPVFVTPDALGDWWQNGKLHRKLMVDLNGQPFGRAEAGETASRASAPRTAVAGRSRSSCIV